MEAENLVETIVDIQEADVHLELSPHCEKLLIRLKLYSEQRMDQ